MPGKFTLNLRSKDWASAFLSVNRLTCTIPAITTNFITSLPPLTHERFFGSFCRLNQHVWLWQHFLQLFSCSFEAVAFLPGQPYLRCGKWAGVPNLTKMTAWPVLNLSSVASILSRSVEKEAHLAPHCQDRNSSPLPGDHHQTLLNSQITPV